MLRPTLFAIVTSTLLFHAPLRAAPTTLPAADEPALVPGLVMDVYDLPRMPTRLRRLIPGSVPSVSRVITDLRLPDKAAFGGRDEKFQMLLRGFLQIDQAGEYAFRLNTDDGSQLLIDGQQVAINDGVHGQNPGVVGITNLTAGRHAVLVRYFQADYGFGFNLTWKPPGAADFTAIPADALRARPSDVRVPTTAPATMATTLPASTQPTEQELDAIAYHVCVSGGFGELNEKTGDLLIALLNSPNQISDRARHAIGKMLRDVRYDELSKENQGRFLKGFLQSTFGFQTSRDFKGERAPVTFAPAKEMPLQFWNGRKAVGYRTIATLDGRELQIDATKADMPEVERAALAVAGLPDFLRRYVKRVIIDPNKQNQYNGGGDTIWIRLDRTPPQSQIDSTFSHEIGHVLMSHTGADADWQAIVESDYVPVSGYGNRNLSEDFAEFTRLYLSCEGNAEAIESLRTLYPKRYPAFMTYWNRAKADFAKRSTTAQSGE